MVLRWLKLTADEDYHVTPRGVSLQMEVTHWIHNNSHPLNICPTLE